MSDLSDTSDPSGASTPSDPSPDRLRPKHGGYRRLRSFDVSQAVFDGTVVFCDRFIDRRDRTHDQMVQAARSGTRNIAEGSVASGTSKKMELKLTGVARASLEELMLDYQDFLRHRGLRLWDKDSPEALAVRHRYKSDPSAASDPSDPYSIRTATPEVAANTLLCLVNQASYLLGRQLDGLDRTFLEEGGFTERLYAARTKSRAAPSSPSDRSDRSDPPKPPACLRCGRPMVRRIAKKGPRAGQPFWGCSGYPDCTATRSIDPP